MPPLLKALLVVLPEFFVDIVGRMKYPAYIRYGDTPTRNTNLVNLTTVCVCVFSYWLFCRKD